MGRLKLARERRREFVLATAMSVYPAIGVTDIFSAGKKIRESATNHTDSKVVLL